MEEIGFYLDGDELGEILLPKQYINDRYQVGDKMEVFIYLDSEDRFIATTEKPIAQVGDFALLHCVSANEKIGAFVDWGLPKDLLVPKREQQTDMIEGNDYVVYIYVDELTNRLVASTKINKYLDEEQPLFEMNDEVDLMIIRKSEIGYIAIINNEFTGMIYHNEIFQELSRGQKLKGYIKKIREDLKIDLSLTPIGLQGMDKAAELIYNKLAEHNGFILVNDKSPAELIYTHFKVSKKVFKKAVGALYKQRLIVFKDDGIMIND